MIVITAFGSKNEVKKVSLSMAEDKEGIIILAVDKNGKPIKGGAILRILHNGVLVRIPSVSPAIGLKLNSIGQVLEKVLLKKSKEDVKKTGPCCHKK